MNKIERSFYVRTVDELLTWLK